jgi:hypothetical protein
MVTPSLRTPWYESNLLWGAASLIVAVIAARVPDVRWLLAVAWIPGCAALWFSFRTARSVLRRLASTAASVLILAGCLYTLSGALKPVPHELTTEQRALFTNALRSAVAPPNFVEVSCPAAREDVCVYANSFIPLFQRAGWKVDGPVVKRVTLGRPLSGVVVVKKGPPLVDPQNPDQGVWTEVGPWEQLLKTAFAIVDISTGSVNDPQLPADRIRVYFGSIPS